MNVLPLIFILLAVLLLVLSRRKRESIGLPTGSIIFDDTGRFTPPKPLFSRTYKLTGKPDYLVRQGESVIPVEIKSTRAPAAPYDSHVAQVMAYCLLVEDVYGIMPTHGRIVYPDRTFDIAYTPENRAYLLNVMDTMRGLLKAEDVPRDHEHAARCRSCQYKAHCGQGVS